MDLAGDRYGLTQKIEPVPCLRRKLTDIVLEPGGAEKTCREFESLRAYHLKTLAILVIASVFFVFSRPGKGSIRVKLEQLGCGKSVGNF